MSNLEIDPLFSTEIPDYSPKLEVTIEDTERARQKMLHILNDAPLRSYTEEDGSTSHTRKAQYKLPNGDRLDLEFCYFEEIDAEAEPVIDTYTIFHFRPLFYDAEGRLLVRRRNFNLNLEHSYPQDVPSMTEDKVIDLSLPEVPSLSSTEIREVNNSAFDIEIAYATFREVLEEAYLLGDVKRSTLIYTPEIHGWLEKQLDILTEANVTQAQAWPGSPDFRT